MAVFRLKTAMVKPNKYTDMSLKPNGLNHATHHRIYGIVHRPKIDAAVESILTGDGMQPVTIGRSYCQLL